jgi:glycosyltransferase involved in cell wall biosynthesis
MTPDQAEPLQSSQYPRVIVGMPVYNGERTVEAAIQSILDQSFRKFRLIISDNASTDRTADICKEFANRDARLTYIRQPYNLGTEANFSYVLAASACDYFCWAAADDTRSPDFLELTLQFLDSHPDYIAATCPTRFKGSSFNSITMGDQSSTEDDPYNRILSFFDCWHANARFCSLFRYRALRSWLVKPDSFLGADWLLVLQALSEGKSHRLESGYVELGKHGISNSLTIFSRYRTRPVHWIFPFFDLSKRLIQLFAETSASGKVKLFATLIRINAIAFKTQIVYELRRLRESMNSRR